METPTMSTDRMEIPAAPNGELPPPPASSLEIEAPIRIGTTGIMARKRGDTVTVSSKEGVDLFAFNARVVPYDANAISFLLEIYTIGYTKGRGIGRELMKAQLREMLGPEL
jgi:hypothetical protein